MLFDRGTAALALTCCFLGLASSGVAPAVPGSPAAWQLSVPHGNVLEIASADHATAVVGRESRNRTVVLACLLKNDTARRTALEQAAYFDEHRFVMYAVTGDERVCQNWERRSPTLMLFNPYQPRPQTWAKKDIKTLTNRRLIGTFVKNAAAPLVNEFDGSAMQGRRMAKSHIKLMLLAVVDERNAELFWPTLSKLTEMAHDFVGKAHFYYARHTNRRVLRYFNVSRAGPFPQLLTLDMRAHYKGEAVAGKIDAPTCMDGMAQWEKKSVAFLGTPDKWKSLVALGINAAKLNKPLKPNELHEDGEFE